MADFDDRLKQLEEEIERRLVERFAALRDEFDRLRLESDHRWAGFVDRFDQKFSGIVPLELMQSEPQRAAPAAAAAPAGGIAAAAAARSLDEAANQVDALHRFLDLCRNHCSRAALLVTRGDSTFVWKAVGFSDHGINDELIRRASLPSSPDDPLARVLEGQPIELPPGSEISEALSAADATRAVLITMVVKEKISGALYADCAPGEEPRFDPEALAFLTFLAGLVVDRLASRKLKPAPPLRPLESAALPPREPAAEASAVAPEPAPRPAAAEPEFELAEEPSRQAPAPEPGYRTQMMQAVPAAAPAAPAPPPPSQFSGAPAEVEAEPRIEMPLQRPSEEIPISLPPLEPEPSLAEEPAPGATVRIPTSVVEDALSAAPPPEPQPRPTPPPPAAPRPSTGARRLAGPLAPAEGDERREEARRFAKLLVSEIKLYNEKAVVQGREQGNIYELLKEDIDRSRQMYDERIPEDVRSGSNFFYEELVRILADGRADALGL